MLFTHTQYFYRSVSPSITFTLLTPIVLVHDQLDPSKRGANQLKPLLVKLLLLVKLVHDMLIIN